MRWHLRLISLCAVAVFVAGCSNSDRTQSDSTTAPSYSTLQCKSSIGDRVWFDTNCNGIQDEGEDFGPEGLTVELRTCAGDLVATTTTDANGNYVFGDVEGELSYKVCFELPFGYGWSPAHEPGAAVNSDVNADGCTDCFVLECDKPAITKDAGLCEKKGEGEGCTPGFWRNHLLHWADTPYDPGMDVNDTFGCDLVDGDVTLGEAIDAPQTYGALVFHAIAALLNASHPDVDYDLSVGEVIDAACEGDKDTLSEANEEGCPLSGGNTTGQGGGSSDRVSGSEKYQLR